MVGESQSIPKLGSILLRSVRPAVTGVDERVDKVEHGGTMWSFHTFVEKCFPWVLAGIPEDVL